MARASLLGALLALGACDDDDQPLWGRNPAAHALIERHDWPAAATVYRGLSLVAPDDLAATAGLLYAQAQLAEAAERVVPGAADYWLVELVANADDAEALAGLERRVGRAGCGECAATLERLARARESARITGSAVDSPR